MVSVGDRLKHAWNAFSGPNETEYGFYDTGQLGSTSYEVNPNRRYLRLPSERTIISSIYTRIAIDAASVPIKHVRLDERGRYKEDIVSGLNNCLGVEANLDQSGIDLRMDIVQTVLEKGVAAIVPVDTTLNPNLTGGYDIETMRVGEITQWFPKHVRVSVYNEARGIRQQVILEKKYVGIVVNPLYAVMNEPNSTLQRLLRKMALLDVVDEQSSSGKLDIIIQLPYVIKHEAQRNQAEKRRKDIEAQLAGSQYGIAYTDGTEKITQLNRPAENNLLKQVDYLTEMLYGQLGLTPEVMNGTADEATMLNYQNRTIAPILTVISEEMRRKFLTKTARSQNQSIMFFRDPFKLVPLSQVAEIADKLARNEIMSSNEIRQGIGMTPSDDPKADELHNSNMPAPSESAQPPETPLEGDSQNGRR